MHWQGPNSTKNIILIEFEQVCVFHILNVTTLPNVCLNPTMCSNQVIFCPMCSKVKPNFINDEIIKGFWNYHYFLLNLYAI